MKTLLAFLAAFVAFHTPALADYQSDVINAENYSLRDVMVSNRTYAGVCVNSEEVQVRTGRRGIVAGLTLGLVNVTCGTSLGVKNVPARRYVIRLDQERGDSRQAKLVTIVQGPSGTLIPAGTPVFIETSGGEASFSARVIAAAEPGKYATQGVEEARQASMDR